RTARGLALTAAGTALVTEAAHLISTTRAAVTAVRGVNEEARRRVRIGVSEFSMWSVLMPHLNDFRARHPEFEWVIREIGAETPLDALHAGEIDLGVCREPLPQEALLHRYRLTAVLLARDEVALALPAAHALSHRSAIGLADLAGEPMVTLADDTSDFQRYLTGCCAAAGFLPRVRHQADKQQIVLALVGHNMGIGLMPASLSAIGWPGVVFKRLRDAPPANVYAVHSLRNRAAPLRALLELLPQPFGPS
ncbi:MAG TPA: LysR substrate-binding domain-containing protein, partial [Telluria sp.]|nr:LysR substrate-binding domain-containing protein [Telluria sp.]